MPVSEADLHADLREKSELVSAKSAEIKSLRKELGAARDGADRVPELEAEIGKLAEALEAARRESAALLKDLKSANARAEAGDAAVAAGKSIAGGLKQLGAL